MSSPVTISMSSTRIYARTTANMTIIVSKNWREQHHIDEKLVYRAGVEAQCVDPSNRRILGCSRCGKHNNGRPLKIVVSDEFFPEYSEVLDREKYKFQVKPLCTSSRDHLKSEEVVIEANIGSEAFRSTNFSLRARKSVKTVGSKRKSSGSSADETQDDENSPTSATTVLTFANQAPSQPTQDKIDCTYKSQIPIQQQQQQQLSVTPIQQQQQQQSTMQLSVTLEQPQSYAIPKVHCGPLVGSEQFQPDYFHVGFANPRHYPSPRPPIHSGICGQPLFR